MALGDSRVTVVSKHRLRATVEALREAQAREVVLTQALQGLVAAFKAETYRDGVEWESGPVADEVWLVALAALASPSEAAKAMVAREAARWHSTTPG